MMDAIETLYCGRCTEQVLDRRIEPLEARQVTAVDGETLVPEGFFVAVDEVAPQLYFTLRIPITHFLNTVDIQLADHEDPGRMAGCCGPSNFERFNQVCPRCSRSLGVLFADCLGPHFTAIDMSRLTTTPKW